MVMALRFTGQPGPICAVHCCEYSVSPGNAGVSDDTIGEMSQRVMRKTIAGLAPAIERPGIGYAA